MRQRPLTTNHLFCQVAPPDVPNFAALLRDKRCIYGARDRIYIYITLVTFIFTTAARRARALTRRILSPS